MMKQKILRKRGALQEGFGDEAPVQQQAAPTMASMSYGGSESAALPIPEEEFPSYVQMHQTNVNIPTIRGAPSGGVQTMSARNSAEEARFDPATGREIDPFTGRYRASDPLYDVSVWKAPGASASASSSLDPTLYRGRTRMFRTTIPEGQRVLVYDRTGKGAVVEGPKRISTWGRRIEPLEHHVAYPGEFLIVRYRDGRQEHLPGPCEAWLDPRIHVSIAKEDSLQIAAKEAVVVYSREEEGGTIHRRIVRGPAVFVPEPGEWLHTFSWHGSRGEGYRKVPGALVFQKLWLMPDQMYHDVDDVRTADDVVLTVRLMIFFELIDLDRMLEETHDPIGDFINAASSDVLDLVGRHTFDAFKTKTEHLNDLEHYSQLTGRAKQVGYKIHKIVYRGYSTARALESMHEQAIEARTRLKLERETENQAQELADFKQQREAARALEQHNLERQQAQHERENLERNHEQQLRLTQQRRDAERQQRHSDAEQRLRLQQEEHKAWLQTLASLKELGVDLSAYLTQGRADRVIELRGPHGDNLAPHLHLPPEPNSSDD